MTSPSTPNPQPIHPPVRPQPPHPEVKPEPVHPEIPVEPPHPEITVPPPEPTPKIEPSVERARPDMDETSAKLRLTHRNALTSRNRCRYTRTAIRAETSGGNSHKYSLK
jgi:hypothetical protein